MASDGKLLKSLVFFSHVWSCRVVWRRIPSTPYGCCSIVLVLFTLRAVLVQPKRRPSRHEARTRTYAPTARTDLKKHPVQRVAPRQILHRPRPDFRRQPRPPSPPALSIVIRFVTIQSPARSTPPARLRSPLLHTPPGVKQPCSQSSATRRTRCSRS